MRRPRRRAAEATAIKALAFVSALACAVALAGGGATATPQGDPRTLSLVDQDGRPFRVLDLAGKPALITFVATRCSDACPISNAVFFKLESALRRDHVDATLLTVTLDPSYDTPYVMAGFARQYKASAPAWRFASGSVRDVRGLMASLGVVAKPAADGIPEEHSSYVYLLDKNARLARTFLLSADFAKTGERALKAL